MCEAAKATIGITQAKRTGILKRDRPITDWRLRQAMDVPLQGHLELVVEPAFQPAGRRREMLRLRPGFPSRNPSGSPSSDALRSTRARTSRTSSTTRSRRKALCLLLEWHCRIISSSGAISTPCCAFSTERSRIHRGSQSAKLALSRAHGRSHPVHDLHLGCKALSLFSALRYRCGATVRTGSTAIG